jgi:hypothetical protein
MLFVWPYCALYFSESGARKCHKERTVFNSKKKRLCMVDTWKDNTIKWIAMHKDSESVVQQKMVHILLI